MKTGYKTAPQQQYRIHQGTYAFLKLTISSDKESVEEIIARCTSHLNEELQLKSLFYVDDEKGFVLQQYADAPRIYFSQKVISENEEVPESISQEEKEGLRLEEGAIAKATYYTKKDSVILILTTFSCVLDEHSLGLLAQELISRTGVKLDEAEEISYLQYANWQAQLVEENKENQAAKKENKDQHGEQWVYRIKPSSTPNYVKKSCKVEESVQSQIIQLGKQIEVSPGTIFIAAFAICCYRLNLSKNAAFGATINGRYFDEIQKLKGVMAKTFPFYVEISDETSFLDLLKVSQKEYEELQESHANLKEQEEDISKIQFVINSIHNLPGYDCFSPSESFSLRYEISTSESEVMHAIRYDKETISEVFVENVESTLDVILKAITKETNSKVSSILFGESIEKSIHPKKEYSQPKTDTLDTLFQEVLKANKDRIAVSNEIASFSYQELSSMVSQVAHFMSPFTQNSGEGVAVMLDQKVDLPAILLGIWMRGAYYIPIPPDCPEERFKEILKDSGANVLITNRLDIGEMEIPIVHWSLNMWNKSWNQEPKWEQRTSESIAYMIYTSGTSGKPKGVKVADKALINYSHWLKEEFHIEKGAVSSMLSSYAFDLVYTAFWGALCNGAQICIPSSEIILNAEKLVNHIVDEKLTFVKFTPSHLKIIKEAGNLHVLKKSSLQYLFLGGEPIQVEDVKELRKWIPNCKVINHYGPTETTVGVVFTELPSNLDDYAQQPWIGKPIANTTAFILNKENKPLGVGQVGELSISGVSLSLGYHNRKELNEEKFIEIVVNDTTQRVYKTGDLAYKDYQNNIVLLGRSDSQVKINGHRIEIKEIQQSILAKNKAIQDCNVQVIEVNGIQRLLAFIKGNSDYKEELLEDLRKHLPEYMIPEFVFVEKFPLTGNGKVDSKSLSRGYKEEKERKEIVQPETDLEKAFLPIWKEVLGTDNISVTDNFFDLGGDSIRAIQLISRLIKKGHKLEVRNLFEFSEIRSLAAFHGNNSQTSVEKKKGIVKQKAFPLSPLQEGMFFLSLTADKRSYFIQREFQFTGDFDPKRFSAIIQEAAAAFPILKARFFMSENQTPLQEFVEDRKIPIEVYLLENYTKNDQLEAIELSKQEQLKNGVDLSVDHLFTVGLWQIEGDSYQLLLSYHHIILDGWCFQILASKIIEAYYTGESISNDGTPPYSKFIEWIQSRKQENDLKFWENYLQEYSGTTLLKDYFSTSYQEVGYLQKTIEGVVSSKTFLALKDFCKSQRLTQGFVLQQIWGLLLSKYTAREDVVFATTVSGRPPELKGSENMVGLFINTLPYRVVFDPEAPFATWLKNSYLQYPNWLSNQFVRLSDIQSLTPSKENLLKHLFVLENYPIQSSNKIEDRNLGLEIEQKRGEIHLNYDLSLILYPEEDLKIQWIYNGNAYSTDFVQQLNTRLELLIQQLVNTPEIQLKDLRLTEKIQIPEKIANSNENGISQFLKRIESNLDKYKDKIAVKTSSKTLTYQELDEQSNQVKSALLNRYRKGSAIGVHMMASTDLVVAILGALKAGIPYVPLDPKQARLRLQNIAEDSEIQGILSEEILIEKAIELFKGQDVFTLDSLLEEAGEKENSIVVNNEDEAYRIFTSGSTGRPKGCCIQHKNLTHLFKGIQHHFEFNSQDRWIMLHSFGFDFSVWEIWGAIWNGASVYIPEESIARNPEKVKNIISKEKITILNSTPGAFYALIDTNGEVKNWEKTLRFIGFGGDKLEPNRFQEWYSSKRLEHLKLINMYGITETTVHTTFKEIGLDDIYATENLSPIGKPYTGVKIYCFDPYLNELPSGVVGEIFVGGGGVSNGYYNQPELSKKVFSQHPDDKDNLLYRSGDLAFKGSEGEFYYIGRKDHQVQIRGFRIELEEIKNAFLQHPKIKDVVLIKKDGKVIEEDRIEAFFILKNDKERIEVSELRNFLGDRISWYMIPAVFTCVHEIPLTANGKFDASAIVEVVTDKKVDKEQVSYTEQKISIVWEQLLNITNIGLDDDFFDLGGNSLLAIRLITEINKKMKSNIDIGEIFRQRTVRLLATYIEDGDSIKFTSPYQVFNSGKQKKVFFFPPALAFGFVFGRLASELKNHEIIAFNYIHKDTIFEYTKIMQELQPSGKFVLAGFSSGGSLAFEVTKALEEQGREVSDILLLDSKMNKTADLLSDEQCSEIADSFLKDPRAEEYVLGEEQKKLMWETIKKCAKFIHSLENIGIINTQIHLITSDNNHENTSRIGDWSDASKDVVKIYKGKGKHDEMLDPQNFEHNKDHFASILGNFFE